MNVKQLKEALAKYPDDMQVFMAERKTEFTYGLLNGVSKQKINMMEEPNGPALATEMVVILDEE